VSEIHIGFSKGEPVEVPLQHTIVVAITRYGKSTTLKHMKESLPKDFKVLFLDVKRPRDFEGMGVEIPTYLEDRTDPVGLKNLLEASGKMGLKFEFSELIKVCKQCAAEDKEGRYGFRDVLDGITSNLKEKMHPIRESKLLVLQHLLGRLVRDLDKTEMVDELELPSRFNVMDLSKAPRMVKQLAVYSTLKWILERCRNTVIVLDELPDFAPQRHGTPAREVIGEAVRKGGASGIWLWLSGQTITGVDKNVLKECNYWILGRQREWNEAKRTLDQIPFKTDLKVDNIMTLPVGHFIVVSEEGAYLTYVQPPGVDVEPARKVSLGELSVKDVEKLMVMEEEDEMVWKERCEEERQKREELEKEFARQVERLSDLKAQEKIKDLEKRIEEMQKTIMQLKDEKTDVEKQHGKAVELISDLKERLAAFEHFEEALVGLLQPTLVKLLKIVKQAPGFEPGSPVPSEVAVVTEQPALTIKTERPSVELTDKTTEGKIAIVYAEGKLPSDKWFTTTDVVNAFVSHGWPRDPRIGPTLDKMCQWGFFEKHYAGKRPEYRLKMTSEEAKEKGLLKTVEKVEAQ